MAVVPQSRTLAAGLWRSLGVRLVLFLSIALLPLGVIAYIQTRDLAREAQSREGLTLITLTQRAASGERQAIERAFGAAEALAAVLDLIRDDPAACRTYLESYLGQTDRYSFIGFLPPDGRMRCSSVDRDLDFSGSPDLAPLNRLARQELFLESDPAVSGESVIIVSTPTREDGELMGFVMLSIPVSRVTAEPDLFEATQVPSHLITFNGRGEILTRTDDADLDVILPADRSLAAFVGARAVTFAAASEGGAERVYSVTPLVPGTFYALAAWDPDLAPLHAEPLPIPLGSLPILMWVASLMVAFLAVHRLVIRHIRALGRNMRAFAQHRHMPPDPGLGGASGEIQEMETDFRNMAQRLLSDEALLEHSVWEKNVLLKEVHHRVKNNLQLISSIMNMHIRKARSPETQAILRRLQDRVLGLATVHRNLYKSENLSRTNAAILLSEIVKQQVQATPWTDDLDVRLEVEDIALYPDQAVPISMLTAELCTNAMKYLSTAEGEAPWLAVCLREVAPKMAELRVSNPAHNGPVQKSDTEPVRLGDQLMEAFAMQLGGRVERTIECGIYRARVRFTIAEFSPDPVDF